ncbi:D-amino-acid oxidase [Asanoa ishikariensis]|uniref:D-amino-acid oxidase n=1 Tax=Asanoa ishikariensis TaxID=137265 RepID=A0A1H3TYJ0_9ACTN|nr:FAD-dependent oxidoreductase [Asanoa ishikariensis]GIF67705.1 D-amino-acid oxidase [Asanoa ishikariensis]SDZ55260.1 D-amino-acid:oxygen oxidoreductase [Asanoa ishikariensis]
MADVVVLGAGIIGLTSALALQEAGAEVAVVAAEEPQDTVSAVAAAVWYPTRIDADPRVLGWGTRTFEVFSEEAGRGAPGVSMRPTRMIIRSGAEGRPWWAPAVPDFSADPGEWRFTVPAVEMVPYLAHLLDRFRGNGGTLTIRKVDRFEELDAPTVVNATGLGAAPLAGDDGLYPIRGQVVVVDNPGLTTSIRDEHHPLGPVYIHPRSSDVVLGGTFEVGDADRTIRAATAEAIIERTTQVEPRLAGARVRNQLVGLRPARHGGPRVEAQGRIIHAYGHSGAGMTLCWGTAEEVARLAR